MKHLSITQVWKLPNVNLLILSIDKMMLKIEPLITPQII